MLKFIYKLSSLNIFHLLLFVSVAGTTYVGDYAYGKMCGHGVFKGPGGMHVLCGSVCVCYELRGCIGLTEKLSLVSLISVISNEYATNPITCCVSQVWECTHMPTATFTMASSEKTSNTVQAVSKVLSNIRMWVTGKMTSDKVC